MNNAGLPGTGIGGLFYLLLALCMPVVEVVRTVRGDTEPGRWRQVLTQFALACAILVSLVGTAAVYLRLVDAPSPFGLTGTALVLAPVVLAALLLCLVVVVLRVWARLLGPEPELRTPVRVG
ncbi:hypothetical protein [Nocardioides rubriscoriae]|uniref:hypothetical protein n=1 Tax=Nocardioides rubriscoriae TaxID=642762 RepID=UPI0011DFAAA1|nr:hypothetical protein [Nocardioides rubriscoriae]